ncbi:hypothetical protein DRN74_02925 [Candidatus Micrarchaeota archaeon]|nr:MAG: hypothetical protein DRN74_02925 [Candidatus Micrarchaeota archaeon]
MIEEKEVDRALSEAREAFSKSEYLKLRDMSNDLLRDAILNEETQLIELSLLCYALYKIASKSNLRRRPEWEKFKKDMLHLLKRAEEKSQTREELDKVLREMLELTSSFYENLGIYIDNVVEKARLKQAIRAYSMGLSLGQAAALTGVSKGRLLSMIGKTKIHDRHEAKTAIERYKDLKGFLEG